MNKIASSLPLLFFFIVAALVDVLGVVINSFMISAFSVLLTPTGAALAGIGAVVLFFEKYFINLGITEAATEAAMIAGVFFLCAQLIASLIAAIVFYSIVLSSPKGTFSTLDCALALGIFILEAIPFVGGLPIWGWFAAFLRRKMLAPLVPGKKRGFSSFMSGGKKALSSLMSGR